jgi:2-C-methyl-D-erythritol 4-phosphate cytidylyltransferase
MSARAALITAAGSSVRMGSGEKKEYRLLGGHPVLVRSLLAFRDTGLFSILMVVVPPGHIERVREMVAPHLGPDGLLFAEGGDTRRESVHNGLKALAERGNIDVVLIHDAARPWVTGELIVSVLAAAEEHGAAIPVTEVSDALVETGSDGIVTKHMPKTNLRGVQTPQGFKFPDIWKAHQKARSSKSVFYDDAQVFMRSGGQVFALPGDPANRKITYEHDLEGS